MALRRRLTEKTKTRSSDYELNTVKIVSQPPYEVADKYRDNFCGYEVCVAFINGAWRCGGSCDIFASGGYGYDPSAQGHGYATRREAINQSYLEVKNFLTKAKEEIARRGWYVGMTSEPIKGIPQQRHIDRIIAQIGARLTPQPKQLSLFAESDFGTS